MLQVLLLSKFWLSRNPGSGVQLRVFLSLGAAGRHANSWITGSFRKLLAWEIVRWWSFHAVSARLAAHS